MSGENVQDLYKNEKGRRANLFYQVLFGDKWTATVINCLYHRAKGFNELLADLYISASNLSTVLKKLERYGLVARTVLPTHPVSVRYALTECGTDFVETMGGTQARFILKWFPEETFMSDPMLDSLLRREPFPEPPPERE